MAMLKEETEKLQILTNNTFTFNDEDNVATFNKREILLNIPKYKLYELAKHYKIQKYKKGLLQIDDFLSLIYDSFFLSQ